MKNIKDLLVEVLNTLTPSLEENFNSGMFVLSSNNYGISCFYEYHDADDYRCNIQVVKLTNDMLKTMPVVVLDHIVVASCRAFLLGIDRGVIDGKKSLQNDLKSLLGIKED